MVLPVFFKVFNTGYVENSKKESSSAQILFTEESSLEAA